jgi:hypothetical protein
MFFTVTHSPSKLWDYWYIEEMIWELNYSYETNDGDGFG